MHEIPPFLRQRGIREVLDNLPEDRQVRARAKLFFLLFRDEIVEHLTRPTPKADQGER